MYYPSSVRKNYFFSAQSSIISQKRQQESGSNSHNSSKSVEGKQKKSLNNSFDKIKKDLTKRQEQHYSDFQHIYVTKRLNNQMKPRRNSINSILPTSNITRLKNSIPSIQSKSKQFQNSPSNYFSSKILEKITPPLQQIKLKKMNSENSQISTQIPSITNNFLIEERYGFVRFSQILIETPKPRKDSKSVKRESISILKKKNAFSCSKLDSSYLKLRSTGPPERQKIVDAIQHKYKQILQNLRQKFARRTGKKQFPYLDLIEDEKYNDELFPANNTSIFWTKAKLQQIKINIAEKLNNEEIIQIGWKRLTDIFNPIRQKVILYKENSNQKVIKNEFSVASNDYLMSFNAISNVSLFFKKIFENCQTDYEKHGIYCLKIFQENCWKSIIIDDYIPVIIHKNIKSQEIKIKTLSLDIEVSENCSEIEIWPFLLEKAYASYYNSYESLFQNFNLIDWLQQILMTPSECYYFPDNQQLNEQNVKRLEKILNQFPISQSIIIGFKIKTAQPCIILKKELKNYPQIQDVTIKTIKSQRKMKIRNLFQTFHTFYLFMPFTFKYFNACPGNFMKASKKIVQQPVQKIKIREQIIVRSFLIQEQGLFSISLRQKQKRFYGQNRKKYEYIWIRVILTQKEFNNTYRWIEGKYSNEKSTNFSIYLQKGEYQLLILPEIQANENLLQLTLIMLSNSQIFIQKKLYEQSKHVLQLACYDISQRNGLFRQINSNICNYSYIEKNTGIIIENINNEKQHGAIAINRSMINFKSKVEIVPFNLEFCINNHEPNIHKRRYKRTIQLLIESQECYTVVFMMKGGVDKKFLKTFKFENC